MTKIFISYKRLDKDKVFPIVREIKNNTGIDCWIDLVGIESGDQFQNVIISAIDNSDIVIFMLTKNFIAPYKDVKTGKIDLTKQTFPEKEVMYALRHNKRLIPISIDGTYVYDCKWLDFNCSGLDCIDWNVEESKQKLLNNLPDVCKYVIKDGNTGKIVREDHTSSYIDVELELVAFDNDDFSDYSPNRNNRNKLKSIVIDEQKLQEIGNNPCVQEIDVCNARRVNMVYNVGADIDNLPSDDPNTAERYSKALLYFCYQQTPKDTLKKWEELCDENNKDTLSYQIKLRNKLSNVLCADCFTTRLKSVCKNFEELLEKNEKMVLGEVQKNLQVLAQCEHARWNVEKLILGFSPLSLEERWKDAQNFGSARKVFRKKLKDKGHHIDLCSYQDLHRIDPANMKYDCFLNLAMVRILKEANGI